MLHRFFDNAQQRWSLAGFIVASLMISCCAAGEPRGAKDQFDNLSEVEACVSQLDDNSYVAREDAKARLLECGDTDKVLIALRRALTHERMEVRESAKQLLAQVIGQQREKELRNLQASARPKSIELDGWNLFASLAGTDHASRKLFAEITRRHPSQLWLLEQLGRPASQRERELILGTPVARSLGQTVDPFYLPSQDAVGWALLLCFDSPKTHRVLPNLSARITQALAQSGVGPRIDDESDAAVIQRLIGQWIERQPRNSSRRDRLIISMHYRCDEQARRICQRVFADNHSTPAEQATAMLCASVLQMPDLERQLWQRIDDKRTAHVWQLIASRKTKIRTQVSDVAMALLLFQRGIDPRTVGYSELQADPLVVFRERSLGFSSETERQNAYADAAKLLHMPR